MCELQFLTQRDRNDVSIEKIVSSVTRFDEISPLWQHFEGLFLIWQNIKPTLENWLHTGIIFIVTNGQILKHNLTNWSH